MKKIFRTPALVGIVGFVFFLLIQWPFLSFIDKTLLEEPYVYWFAVWGVLIASLSLFALFVEKNDQ